jgi:phage shock protein A
MAESILIRMKRMVTGGVTDIVEAMETSQGESVMREAVREIERAIDETRAEAGRVASKRIFASRQAAMIREKISELTGKARLALGEGRADVAEALVARQIDLEAQIPVIESAERDASAEETELLQCLSALQGRKREMEADLEAFAAARRVADRETQSGGARIHEAAPRKAEKASETFNRVMKNASGISGVGATDAGAAAKLAEFDATLRQRQIAERLAALQKAS